MHTVFKVSELALWKKIHGVHKVLLQFEKSLFIFLKCRSKVRGLLSFFEKSRKTFLQYDLHKKLRQTH